MHNATTRTAGLPMAVMDLIIGACLALVALVTYLVTLSAGAYPGESAGLIVEFTGLFPSVLPTHPLWAALVWVVSRIPLGDVATRLNLLSALCGAGAVWLVYEIMRTSIERVIVVDAAHRYRTIVAVRLSGVASALFLAFCVPFWMVSNRAHTATLDVLLLLAVVWTFLRWLKTGGTTSALVTAFICALASVEFATAILLLPLLGITMLFRLWRMGRLHLATGTSLLLAVLAGLSLYLISAWIFYGSEGYVLRGYTSYFHVVRQMLRMQYLLLAHSLPREGWLIVLFVTVVPWITALVVGRRALNGELDWSYYLLHLIMTVLVVLVLVNVKIAPWPMLKEQAEFSRGRLLVTPYVLSAAVFGYLVAYWFLLPSFWWQTAEDSFKVWLRKWLGTACVVPLLAGVIVMPFFNAAAAGGRQAEFVNLYAHAVIDSLAGREWLVTDGSVDNHLRIAASDRRNELKLLSLPSSGSELYMKHVAGMFDSVRIKNLAEVGMLTLIHEWMSTDDSITARLAVQSIPDLWVGEGYTPVPGRLVFLGAEQDAVADVSRLLREHEELWNRLVPYLRGASVHSGYLNGLRDHMLRHTGLVANNLGVQLEDSGREQDAFEVYRKARQIDPGNISALLNLAAMVDRGIAPEAAGGIRSELDMLVKGMKTKYRIWSLSRYYGYVRLPQAFAQLGLNWALSGQPGLAVAGVKRAMDLMPEAQRSKMKHTLAGLYLSDRDDVASEALYKDMLAENPKSLDALFGMCRVALTRGKHREALTYLRQAQKAGAPRARVASEWAALLAASGNTAKARIVLDELLELNPSQARAWAMLVAILVQDKDEQGLARCIERMRLTGAGRGMILSVAEGHRALMRNAVDEAQAHFENVLALKPDHAHVLDVMLRLDVLQRREDDAAERARMLLTMDPGNALANYIRGSIQLRDGQLMLAEDSFRKSLAGARRSEVLNDLAWLLQTREAYEEAERLAREALEMNDAFAGAWDTLGVILTKTERLSEAEEALTRSLAGAQGNPEVLLHLAELYARKGDKKRLRELVETLTEQERYLSRKQLKALGRLRAESE